MKTTINGEQREFPDGITLGEALRDLGVATAGIAVAVNERVIARTEFDRHYLRDGDAAEIIRAVAGG
jgi:sulfur carrier protein